MTILGVFAKLAVSVHFAVAPGFSPTEDDKTRRALFDLGVTVELLFVVHLEMVGSVKL